MGVYMFNSVKNIAIPKGLKIAFMYFWITAEKRGQSLTVQRFS